MTKSNNVVLVGDVYVYGCVRGKHHRLNGATCLRVLPTTLDFSFLKLLLIFAHNSFHGYRVNIILRRSSTVQIRVLNTSVRCHLPKSDAICMTLCVRRSYDPQLDMNQTSSDPSGGPNVRGIKEIIAGHVESYKYRTGKGRK